MPPLQGEAAVRGHPVPGKPGAENGRGRRPLPLAHALSRPQPMSREYQHGGGFGYLVSFRRQGGTSWQTARVPGADAQYFVYSNDSVRPYTPFEVKIRSYNRRGDGPESLVAVVYSAEEGGPPGPPGAPTPAACLRGVGWGRDPLPRLGSTGGAGETPGCLSRPIFRSLQYAQTL